MAWGDRKPRSELQTEAPEVANLQQEVERNRSNSVERPRLTTVVPPNSEGRDGDHKFVVVDNVTWAYWRVNGRWKKVRMEDG